MNAHGAALLAKTVTEYTVSSAWEGILLVAAVTWLLRLLRGLSPAARFFVWSAVLLLLFLTPLLHLGHPSSTLSIADNHPHLALPLFSAWTICAVWLTLSIYRATQLLRSACHVVRVKRESHLLDSTQRHRIDLPAAVLDRIATSQHIDVPCVAGFVHPRILLPAYLLEHMSSIELGQIIQHELEHIRRGDPWLNLLQKLSLVVLPLNPALWWAERRLCAERELACDDRVLTETHAPKAYAMSLTNLAELSLSRRTVSLMLGALRKRSELGIRVHRILASQNRWGKFSTACATAVLSLAAAVCVAGLSRVPSIISFTESASAIAPLAVNAASSVKPVTLAAVDAKPIRAPQHIRRAKLHMPAPIVPAAQSPAMPDTTVADATANETNIHLAAYEKSLQKQPREQPVVFEEAHHTYAAFRLADGWLLIQL